MVLEFEKDGKVTHKLEVPKQKPETRVGTWKLTKDNEGKMEMKVDISIYHYTFSVKDGKMKATDHGFTVTYTKVS
jgi:hypothetical protein